MANEKWQTINQFSARRSGQKTKLWNHADERGTRRGRLNEMAPADLSELIQYQGQVYNADIFEKHQMFKDICQNDLDPV